MPQGKKSSYTNKQKRQANAIEDSEIKAGKSAKSAARIGYATVNKESSGGKKSRVVRKGEKSGSASHPQT